MNQAMKFQNFIHLFKKRKKLILLVTFLLTFIGGFGLYSTTYEAKADVIVKLTTENFGTSLENEKFTTYRKV
jgi:capsular polysaccharide biosynthesis protein